MPDVAPPQGWVHDAAWALSYRSILIWECFVLNLMLAIGGLALGSSLFWLSRRSLRSRKACLCAREDLHRHGRAVLSPPLLRRLLGLGPLVLDVEGMVVHRRRSVDHYTWVDVPEPFTLKPSRAMPRVGFRHRRRNPNYGKRRLFGNTRDEFVTVQRAITSAYGLRWSDLLDLLNAGRNRPAAFPAVPMPHVPLSASAERIVALQGKRRSSPPHSGGSFLSGWAIKGTLGLAIVVAFGFVLSSFSWMSGPATTGDELGYATDGVDGGGGVGGGPLSLSSPSNINPQQHVTRGYYRANGTYVAPHAATNPDSDRTNNLSSRGNTNPYTGARGHR